MKKRDFLAGAGGSLAAGALGALAPGLARAAGPWQPEELAEGTVDSATLEALPGKAPLIKRSYRPTNYETPIDYLRTAFAGGVYAHGRTSSVLELANENNAVLAMTGDYYGIHDRGVVIRNGELYREGTFEDVLVLNYDGSMATYTAEAFDIEAVKAGGAWQAWSFGPMLLDDGQPMSEFNSDVPSLNPRSAIGCFEPGHYCFVLVDGRQEGYSVGMTLAQLSQLFYDLGCVTAYNLDGGQSAVLTFMGQVVNQPYRDGRPVSDIVYIGE